MIGPTVAQLPPQDRVAACRRLVQFLELEEARLISDQIAAAAAIVQTLSSAPSPEEMYPMPFLGSRVATTASMGVEPFMASRPHISHNQNGNGGNSQHRYPPNQSPSQSSSSSSSWSSSYSLQSSNYANYHI